MSWTDERVDTLKRLWTDGLSASQIAASLGEVTRNAVIGKIHRLGLSGRARTGQPAVGVQHKAKPAAPAMRRAIRPTVASVGNTALAAEPTYAVASRPEPEQQAEIVPIGQRVTIMMLTEQTCRWPIGDPGSEGFTFCGRRSDTGIPYCTAHARIAYQPAERRRDRGHHRGDH
jgi:GcrA cell cycle regulator